jgi:HSP20 family protein
MGIIDKVTALLPWRDERHELRPARAQALALRDDFDRWLERLSEDPWGVPGLTDPRWALSADMHETEDALVVTVEVPGLDRDDLDLTITPEGLTIRGEKREEKKDRRKDYHLVESRYGGFFRIVPLPPGLDLDRAEARVKNGVLTVRLPKAGAGSGTRRIPVKT